MIKKKWSMAPAWVGLSLGGALALHSLVPDSTRGLFLKGQQLENLGQFQNALRLYHVISNRHPNSPWAAQALNRQATILSSLGRNSGDTTQLRQAMSLFRDVAQKYPTSTFAADALVSAGNIAFADLRDWQSAEALYEELLARFPGSREYASQATVKLGRVALEREDRENARKWFQAVLLRYPQVRERCAEAQYHLGVAYETLWKDKEHKQWAHNAYEATVNRYPQSIFAVSARERLGLLFYDEASRTPASRRVLIDVPGVPDDILPADVGVAKGVASAGAPDFLNPSDPASMVMALRLLLAARGLDVDEVSLRGWSLRPFVSGFDPAQPGRVVRAGNSDWENVLLSAGLRYSPSSGGKAGEALRDLQRELDMARPPLIFNGRWSLAVGYDSSRNLVSLQSRGARIETVSTKELARAWDVDAPIGGRFAIIGAWAPGEKPQSLPAKASPALRSRFDATPTPGPLSLDAPKQAAEPTPLPTATPLPRQDTATYEYALPALALRSAHERAMSRGAALLSRPGQGSVLLGAQALDALARAFENASRPARQVLVESRSPIEPPQPQDRPSTDAPNPEDIPVRASEGALEGDSPLPSGESSTLEGEQPTPLAPQSLGPPPAGARPGESGTGSGAGRVQKKLVLVPNVGAARRAVELKAWFGAPLSAWLESRRDAIAFCERAGEQNNNVRWQQAANELKASTTALEGARAAMPPNFQLAPGQSELDVATRASLSQVAALLRQARDAERRAASLLR